MRIRVKVLEQDDLIRGLFADIIPLVMGTVICEQRLALELPADVVGPNEIVFCHAGRVAERKRHGLDGVMNRAPGTSSASLEILAWKEWVAQKAFRLT